MFSFSYTSRVCKYT